MYACMQEFKAQHVASARARLSARTAAAAAAAESGLFASLDPRHPRRLRTRRDYGQFSKAQSGKMGPALGRFELSIQVGGGEETE